MANRKSTLRPKTVKAVTKRSAPIDPRPVGGAGGWIVSPPPSLLGGALLENMKRAIESCELLDENNSPIRSERARAAANTFAAALSYVPPKGAEEALAAAVLLRDDADMILNGSTEGVRADAMESLCRRAAGLAAWIEATHKVSRDDLGLSLFDGAALGHLLPHTAAVLDVAAAHDR